MSDNKNSNIKRPSIGYIFWPVGNGDSSTIVVDEKTTMQIDLNNVQAADDDEDPRTPVIERLSKILPKKDGKPFLSVFVLTHPDQDHCRGFQELLDGYTIGELWFTPRVFREYKADLCEDAKKFEKEARRRVKAMIKDKGAVPEGDRVRIIGYDDLLKKDKYKGFPKKYLTTPGNELTELNRKDYKGQFRAFIHAPFKEDAAGDRNDTSVSMQVTLTKEKIDAKTLFFGDLSYPIVKEIFGRSTGTDLEWDIMLAAHHCSKSVMYWYGENGDEKELKQDILDAMESAARDDAYIISSSNPVPSRNSKGADPPHAKAKKRYQEIIEGNHFLCTQERPDEKNPEPIVFEIDKDGINLNDTDDSDDDDNGGKSASAFGAALAKSTKETKPPSKPSRYGKKV